MTSVAEMLTAESAAGRINFLTSTIGAAYNWIL